MKYYLAGEFPSGDFKKSIPSEYNSMSMKDILNVAASENLQLVGVRLSKEELDSNIYPAIVVWGVNHFAVLLGKDNEFVFVADPLFPVVRVPIADFFKKSSGYALICKEGGLPGVHIELCVDKTGVELTARKSIDYIKLFNFSDKIQKISVLSASCSCIDVPEKAFALDPGEEATMPIKLKDTMAVRNSKEMVVLNGSFSPFKTAIVRVYSVSDLAITLEPVTVDFSLQRVGVRTVFIVRIEHPSGATVSLSDKDFPSGIAVGDVEIIKKRDRLSLAKVPVIWSDSGFIDSMVHFNVDAGSYSEKVGVKITAMVY
jgi:hypothetical protein